VSAFFLPFYTFDVLCFIHADGAARPTIPRSFRRPLLVLCSPLHWLIHILPSWTIFSLVPRMAVLRAHLPFRTLSLFKPYRPPPGGSLFISCFFVVCFPFSLPSNSLPFYSPLFKRMFCTFSHVSAPIHFIFRF